MDKNTTYIMAQYNHWWPIFPKPSIRFQKWPPDIDSHNEGGGGIWYNHPALVAVWTVKMKTIPLSAICVNF